MKSLKIVLTAVGIFAVVGGALAFKATKFYTATVYTGTNSSNCTTPKPQTTIQGSNGSRIWVSPNPNGSGCQFTFTTFHQ